VEEVGVREEVVVRVQLSEGIGWVEGAGRGEMRADGVVDLDRDPGSAVTQPDVRTWEDVNVVGLGGGFGAGAKAGAAFAGG
jgi:hypothetical protein